MGQVVCRYAEAFHNELVFTVKEVGMLGGIKIREVSIDEFEVGAVQVESSCDP
jgi:hypothetical protein